MHSRDTLTVALVATPASTASSIYGIYDMLASVGREWDLVMTGIPGPSRVTPIIVAPSAAGFRAENGAYIQPDCAFEDCETPDVACVTDVAVGPNDPIAQDHGEAIDWLKRCHAAGSTVASACSGAMLLAEAGLLDGGEATTHWAFCDALKRRYPKVTVHPSRVLVASGDGQRVITAGGGSSWGDLTLYLVARFLGQEEAMRLAKLYLLEWHEHGQLPFAALARTRQVADRAIAACQEWLGEHYQEHSPVAAMVALSGLAERSFKRRFTEATGMAPIEYVHTLRLEEAKQLLETTDMPVEVVANETGYEDGSFFRRLFRRKVGMTPADYRRRFRAVRTALREAERAAY